VENKKAVSFHGIIKKVQTSVNVNTGQKTATCLIIIPDECFEAGSDLMRDFMLCPVEVAVVKMKDDFGGEAK
jgi:hypothetical protein